MSKGNRPPKKSAKELEEDAFLEAEFAKAQALREAEAKVQAAKLKKEIAAIDAAKAAKEAELQEIRIRKQIQDEEKREIIRKNLAASKAAIEEKERLEQIQKEENEKKATALAEEEAAKKQAESQAHRDDSNQVTTVESSSAEVDPEDYVVEGYSLPTVSGANPSPFIGEDSSHSSWLAYFAGNGGKH